MNTAGTVLAVLVLASALLSNLFVAPVLAGRTRQAVAADEPDPRVHSEPQPQPLTGTAQRSR